MSTTCMVDILLNNCNGKNAKIEFNAVICDFWHIRNSLSLPLCYFMLLALVPLEIIIVTKLSVQLRLLSDYCC